MNDLDNIIKNNDKVNNEVKKIKQKQFYNPYDLIQEEYLRVSKIRNDVYLTPVLMIMNKSGNVYDKLNQCRDYLYHTN